MSFISNEEIYALARAGSDKFANITPESYEDFKGLIRGMTTEEARELTNSFTGSLLMLYLNNVKGMRAKNPYDSHGLIEKFYVPFKGIKENMYTRARKPINPKYINKIDGTSVDQQLYTKPSTESIYYTFNDNYQNTLSIPTDDIKTAVESENGLSMLVSGYMQGLAAEFTIWEREHTANVINEMLNSEDAPLQDSQIVEFEIEGETITRDELASFVLLINNIAESMSMLETTAFNTGAYPKYVDKSELVLLVRPGFKNQIKVLLLASAFNKEELNMDIEIMEVPDFGGLVPTDDGDLTKPLYMVYDEQGRPTDTYTTDSAGTTPFEGDVVFVDTNADVFAVIAEKGLIFIDDQNPYEVGAAPYNFAGRYVTYWCNKPNVGFHYDMYKNCVVVKKKVTL